MHEKKRCGIDKNGFFCVIINELLVLRRPCMSSDGGNGSNGSGFSGPLVWSIAGGKGGTGKSFVTASLSIALSQRGFRVVAVDADLGGANLHSFLGVRRQGKGLSDFFEKKIPLEDLLVDSGLPNLRLISGDVQTLESDGIKYTQKLKLFRHIRGLDADYVILDLGAGAHNNTLDSFIFADRMIVVIMPVKTAIENMYQFVKNVFFRKLKMTFSKKGLKDMVLETWKNRQEHGIKNLRELMDYLRSTLPHQGAIFKDDMENFRIYIILNQVKSSRDVKIGNDIKSVFHKYLDIQSSFTGYLEYDESIWQCINRGQPYLRTYPISPCSRELERIVKNLLEGSELPAAESNDKSRRL
jgi:flagellar biosynthesis protein FlhG